jgi:hypothetical protein
VTTEVVNAVLRALDGVAYIVAGPGRILAVGAPGWDAFAADTRGGGASAQATIGRNLFEAISSEPVRQAYRHIHAAVLGGRRPYIAFEYRCDAPDLKRQMRMSVTRLDLPGRPPALLYQSQILSASPRPWISLFEPERILQAVEAESALPIVRVCGFCQRVDDTAGGWIEADDYYRQGGASEVRVSHGLCRPCAAVAEP